MTACKQVSFKSGQGARSSGVVAGNRSAPRPAHRRGPRQSSPVSGPSKTRCPSAIRKSPPRVNETPLPAHREPKILSATGPCARLLIQVRRKDEAQVVRRRAEARDRFVLQQIVQQRPQHLDRFAVGVKLKLRPKNPRQPVQDKRLKVGAVRGAENLCRRVKVGVGVRVRPRPAKWYWTATASSPAALSAAMVAANTAEKPREELFR